MNKPCARITLDLQQASTPTFVAVKKSDIGREIRITLSDGGFPYEISADCYAVLTGTKPDGNILYNHCDIEGNTIVYEITEQTTAAAGRMKAEVKLYGADDSLVTSATFRIIIDGTVYNDGQVESSSEFSALTQLISQVLEIIKNNSGESGGGISITIVKELPTEDISTSTLYLVKDTDAQSNIYTEYLYVNGSWEIIGSQSLDLTGYIKTINGEGPDENGDIKIVIPDSGGNVDLTGYATEQYVKDYAQPKGEYLTAVPDGYAKTEDIPKKPEDIGAQPSGNYALKTEIPSVPVQSVNGKTGAVRLSASDVGARPDNWMPSAQEVGALPNTYTPPNQTAEQVGADPKGTAASAVSQHNTAEDSHNDIRLELKAINDRLTAFFDSDNQTLDELSEIVAYITNNKTLIDSITTSKVSIADIINNLTSNVTNKPLSAAQGVVLKGLIDAVSNSLANYQPKGNYLTEETDPTVPAWAKKSTKPSYSKSEVGLGNVDNVKQYSASNPPPYPVTSVNGQTGAVIIDVPAVVAIEPVDDDIPKVFLSEGVLPVSKTETTMKFDYISKTETVSGYVGIKCQGNSSMSYPKKNFTIKVFEDRELTKKQKVDFKGWGEQNKFVMKANWIDLTHARNVVSARLWADVVKSRANYLELPELLRTSPNQGAVDGFPVKLYSNGVYQGRYTLNIPKDKWTFNMDDDLETHCILCGENYVSGCFRAAANINGSDWTDELHDTVPASIKTRWNEVISFVMNSSDAEFKANLNDYIDVESAIDYYIFALVSCGLDSMGKNQIYLTYNGSKWFASMYDMDSTWGLYYDGRKFVSAEYAMQDEYESMVGDREGNLLYLRLEELFMDEIKTRYKVLRNSALSITNIINHFERFTDIVPPHLVEEDYASTTADGGFTGIPSKTTNNIQQIRKFAVDRLAYSDSYITYYGMHRVTNTLQYCTNNNKTTYVENGGSYVATLTADDGYELSSVTITMGGANITSTSYANGVINIASVTGDIVITAVCTEIAEYTYTNQVTKSISSDKQPFNGGLGYYNGQELSGSKGTQRAGTNCTVTGFIPVKRGDTIRIKGCAWENTTKTNYIVAYDASFAHWGSTTSGCTHYYGTVNPTGQAMLEETVSTTADGISTVKLWDAPSHDNVAYIRISCRGDGSISVDGAELIVTLNEEIT